MLVLGKFLSLRIYKNKEMMQCNNHRSNGIRVGQVAPLELRGPAAILLISRDTFSDSNANLFRACFSGVSHKYRAIRCKMGYRTYMSLSNKAPRGGVAPCWGIAGMAEKVSRDRGIAPILSQYRAIWGH